MTDKTVSLNTELTQSLNNLDHLRELYKEGQVDWLVMVYQVDGKLYQQVWCEDMDEVVSCTIQGALMNVRDYVSLLVAEEE